MLVGLQSRVDIQGYYYQSYYHTRTRIMIRHIRHPGRAGNIYIHISYLFHNYFIFISYLFHIYFIFQSSGSCWECIVQCGVGDDGWDHVSLATCIYITMLSESLSLDANTTPAHDIQYHHDTQHPILRSALVSSKLLHNK